MEKRKTHVMNYKCCEDCSLRPESLYEKCKYAWNVFRSSKDRTICIFKMIRSGKERKGPRMPRQIQERGDCLIGSIDLKISLLRKEIERLEEYKSKVAGILHGIDDPHALIPDGYLTFGEWLANSPFKEVLLGHVRKNKYEAERMALGCNTYQEMYHVVRCMPVEIYRRMIEENNIYIEL